MKTLEEGLNTLNVSLTPLPVEEYPFTYEDLEISSPIVVGYPVIIGCRVMLCTAPVGRPITHTVTLYINNTPVLSQDVTLTCEFLCAETRVEFEFTPGSTRTYQVEIDGLTGSFTATTEVFVNTPLELVKDAVNEFAGVLGELGLSGSGNLKDAYFTFDPTIVQHVIPNANLECTIGLSIPRDGGWTLGARLIAVKASEYERWLGELTFGHFHGIYRGRLAGGIYGLGIPHTIEFPPDSGNFPTVITTCGDYPDCHNIYNREICGGWEGCTLKSGDHGVNVNGFLDLEPGSWIVLASFVLSVCRIFMSPGPKGIMHRTVLPVECHNYKIYRIGTIDF